MLKVKLQSFGHLMQRADSLEKTLMLGKIEGRRRRGQQRTRWLDGITNSMDVFEQMLGWWKTGKPDMPQSMVLPSETQLSYDTTTSHNVYDTLLHLSDEANTLFTSHFYKDLRPSFKSWLIGKDSDAGRGWGQEEKGTTEDEMAIWHHWLNGRESEWTPGVGDGQGGLACCDSWGCKELDMTEQLNWTELHI